LSPPSHLTPPTSLDKQIQIEGFVTFLTSEALDSCARVPECGCLITANDRQPDHKIPCLVLDQFPSFLSSTTSSHHLIPLKRRWKMVGAGRPRLPPARIHSPAPAHTHACTLALTLSPPTTTPHHSRPSPAAPRRRGQSESSYVPSPSKRCVVGACTHARTHARARSPNIRTRTPTPHPSHVHPPSSITVQQRAVSLLLLPLFLLPLRLLSAASVHPTLCGTTDPLSAHTPLPHTPSHDMGWSDPHSDQSEGYSARKGYGSTDPMRVCGDRLM
jgi:hypothetical protein